MDYEGDIEADFLAIYGIYDYEEVESRKFLTLAVRLFAYEGALTARYMKEQENGNSGGGQKKQIDSEYDRKRLYTEANIEIEKASVTGPDYLSEKLKGQAL